MIPLRPNYTLFLLKELQKQSLNSYGERGQGQLRLLEDIKTLVKAQGSIVFLIDMKAHVENYKSLITDIRKQLYVYLPEAKEEPTNNLIQIVTAIRALSVNRAVLFLLYDFDAFFNTLLLDPRYDAKFFESINILNQAGVRFLSMTVAAQSGSKICFSKKEHQAVDFNFKEVVFPPLTTKEIFDELTRNKLNFSSKQYAFIIALVKQHSRPHVFLEFLIAKLILNVPIKGNFKTRLKRWRVQFDTIEKIPWYKRQYYVKEIVRSIRFKCRNLWTFINNKTRLTHNSD